MAENPNGFVCVGPTSSPDENELPSGFPPNICDDVPEEKYLCSFCKNVLKKAHQTLCGHRYCWACVEWIVRCNKTPICQKCKEDDPQSMNDDSILSLEKVFSDAAVSKEILDLKVHCINPGCTWEERMKNYEDHVSQCEYSLIPCSTGCGLMVLRKKLADHLERECKNNMNECQWCNVKMFMKDMQEHLCEEASIKEAKPFKDEPPSREKSHLHGGIKTRDKCCFTEIGCTFRGGKELLKDHMNSSVNVHLNLLLQFTSTIKVNLLHGCNLANGDDEDASAVALINSKTQHLEKRLSSLRLQGSLSSLQSQVAVESNGLECDSADGASYSGSITDLPLALCSGETLTECQSKISGLERKIQTFENIVTVLNREVEKAQTTMGAFERQNKLDQDIIKNLERKVTDQQHLLALKDVLLNELRMQILAVEDVSYDGIFMWKITDFTRKRQEAIAGRITSLYSPAFYTSRYGYKVRMRVYLNGDGAGRGSHISLFFVMMRGEYDALLQWPFKQKVTFMFLDQNNREHVIDAFRPDLNSSSFQRPVNEMNIASGCPMFFSLCKLDSPKQAYVKDETLFIKCIIDTPT
ncbi:TNF receptor-associated factor 1 [Callorhinchus milii]|uniref:TNF receptor-associated factor n=1 Tax=Callorhinchus milii TaxID=7868 RepID=V9KG66_CALMI|nr:TNF receptor-associated factor 1 [Callorhinchus milii]XP_042193632.1 TNF receptor-associated factor 1 [Callorhinchus milii]XP_042193633.1 TNF receptor-associated factor 1 [Callorhinchus milii]XP_042193634.1 TNF receptor-associated factor 1 [Callorhinchus milii]|eukprot:gi/632969124/ref/XP_007900918.1/ PREDICTED: TNF receptor-associated factor 1-like [Callorhinchus milii]